MSDTERLRDELSVLAFQWAKADREGRKDDAARLSKKIHDLQQRIAEANAKAAEESRHAST